MIRIPVFDNENAARINAARLDHLASLGLDLEGKSVLEPGAGIGLLTSFWESRKCEVVSTEGRPANIEENLARHSWREGRVLWRDLEIPGSHDGLGPFDTVFCYGTLYHVPNPAQALEDLARICHGTFLLETRVWPVDDGQVHRTADSRNVNQALHGNSCLPARDWLLACLRALYGFAYVTARQPAHREYPTVWPASHGSRARAVFAGSRSPLDLPTLSETLLDKQERIGLGS